MALSVLCWSLTPVIITVGVRHMPPMAFTATANGVMAVAMVLVSGGIREWWAARHWMMTLVRRYPGQTSLAVIGNTATYPLFGYATVLTGGAIATVVLELWPLIMCVLISTVPAYRTLRPDQDTRRLTWVGLGLGACGAAAIYVDGIQLGGASLRELTAGVLIALAAAITSTLYPCGSRRVAKPALRWLQWHRPRMPQPRRMVLAELTIPMTTKPFAIGSLGLASYWWEPWTAVTAWGMTLAGAAGIVIGTGALTFRLALQHDRSYGIVAMNYAIPALAIMWLALGTDQTLPSWQSLTFAIALIAIGNVVATGTAKGERQRRERQGQNQAPR